MHRGYRHEEGSLIHPFVHATHSDEAPAMCQVCAGQRCSRQCQPSAAQSEAGETDFQSNDEFLGLWGWKPKPGLSCSLADRGCPHGGREALLAPDTVTRTCESDDKALQLLGHPCPGSEARGAGAVRPSRQGLGEGLLFLALPARVPAQTPERTAGPPVRFPPAEASWARLRGRDVRARGGS